MKHLKTNTPLGFTLLTALSYTGICMSACSKSKDAPPPACKIVTVTLMAEGDDPKTVSFIYGDDNKLKHMQAAGENIEFFYETKGFRQVNDQGNGWSTRSFVELNAAGWPLARKDTIFNAQGITQIRNLTYEYNSQGQVIKLLSDDPLQSAHTYTWDDGNLVKYQLGNTVYILDYYTEKPNKDYSFIDLTLFVSQGINPARSTNLLRSLTNNGIQMVFEYQFDSFGNIKGWEATVPGQSAPSLRSTHLIQCD